MKPARLLILLGLIGSVAVASAQTIYYRGRSIEMRGSDQSYRSNGVLMVSARALAAQTDVRYDQSSDGRTIKMYWQSNQVGYSLGSDSYNLNGRRRDLREQSDNRNGRVFLPFEMFENVSDRAISLDRNGSGGGNWGGNGNGNNNGNWGGNGNNNNNSGNITIEYKGRTLIYGGNDKPYRKDGSVMVAFGKTAQQIPDIRDERDRDRRMVYLYGYRKELSHEERSKSYRMDGRNRDLGTRSEDRNGTFFVPVELFKAIGGNDIRVRVNGGWDNGNNGGWGGNGNNNGNNGNWGGNGSNNDGSPEVSYRGRKLIYSSNERPWTKYDNVMLAFRTTAMQISGLRQERDRDRKMVYLYFNGRELSHREGSRTYRLDGRDRDLTAGSQDRNESFFVPCELFRAIVGRELSVDR